MDSNACHRFDKKSISRSGIFASIILVFHALLVDVKFGNNYVDTYIVPRFGRSLESLEGTQLFENGI